MKRAGVSVILLSLTQIGLVVGGLVALALFPPVSGAMALVALDGRSAGRLAGPAIAHGALLLGRGPLPNILVIDGDRARIARDMLADGVLVIAAPQSWCGPDGRIA